jgi:hypothetical protein
MTEDAISEITGTPLARLHLSCRLYTAFRSLYRGDRSFARPKGFYEGNESIEHGSIAPLRTT